MEHCHYLPPGDVAGILTATSRTYNHTIRPTTRNQVIQAIIGVCEVDDCVFEVGRFRGHELITAKFQG